MEKQEKVLEGFELPVENKMKWQSIPLLVNELAGQIKRDKKYFKNAEAPKFQ